MDQELRYAANCSLLFTELPLLQRPAAAHEAGFDAVEFWWPWPDQPVPGDHDVDRFVDRGAGCRRLPDRTELLRRRPGWTRLRSALDPRPSQASSSTTSMSRSESASASVFAHSTPSTATGSTDSSPQEQDELGHRTADNGCTGGSPHRRHGAGGAGERAQALPAAHCRRCGRPSSTGWCRRRSDNVGFLCDLFHLANNGDDLDQALDRYADRIAHVQIADHPGRSEPGTGTLDLQRYLTAYRGRRLRRLRGARIHPNRRNGGQPRMAAPGASIPFPHLKS